MTRKVTPPTWLQHHLKPEVLSLVKESIQPFLQQVRRDDNGQLPSSIELLRLFFAYMGKENRKFRGIPDATISTNSWKGMS